MRAHFLIPLLLLASCAAPPVRRAAPPEEMLEEIISSGKTPATILWAASSQRNGAEILDLLRHTLDQDSQFKMAVALPMEILSGLEPEMKEKLSRWQMEGRLQITLLPQGGLPTPLLTRFAWNLKNSFGVPRSLLRKAPEQVLKPYDIAQIFVRSAEAWKKNFPPEQEAPGFTLPLGLADEDSFNGCAAAEASWAVIAATGPSIYWRRSNALDLYAAKPLMEIPAQWHPGFYVIDEHYGVSLERAPSLLEEIAELHQKGDFESVSVEFWKADSSSGTALYRYSENSAPFFPHWGSEAASNALWGSPAQRQYWSLMFKSHEDISAYQNSGKARLEELDKLWERYFSLFSSSWTFALRQELQETPEAAQEEGFRQNLLELYHELQKVFRVSPPRPLAASLWSAPESLPAETAGSQSAELFFEDLYDTPAAPEGTADLKSFSVSWTKAEFILEMALEPETEEELSVEIYIDLNRRPYEGGENSLNGSLRAAPTDFWEYAVKGNASSLSVYRQEAGGARLRHEAGSQQEQLNGTWTLRMPRDWIPGKDPARWGWAVCLTKASSEMGSADCLQTYPTEPDTLFFTKPR